MLQRNVTLSPRGISRANKKPLRRRAAGVSIKSLAVPYFRIGSPTLSSALSVFTSEFEMGSGGSRSLWPPGKLLKPPVVFQPTT